MPVQKATSENRAVSPSSAEHAKNTFKGAAVHEEHKKPFEMEATPGKKLAPRPMPEQAKQKPQTMNSSGSNLYSSGSVSPMAKSSPVSRGASPTMFSAKKMLIDEHEEEDHANLKNLNNEVLSHGNRIQQNTLTKHVKPSMAHSKGAKNVDSPVAKRKNILDESFSLSSPKKLKGEDGKAIPTSPHPGTLQKPAPAAPMKASGSPSLPTPATQNKMSKDKQNTEPVKHQMSHQKQAPGNSPTKHNSDGKSSVSPSSAKISPPASPAKQTIAGKAQQKLVTEQAKKPQSATSNRREARQQK